MDLIYKIAPAALWRKAQDKGRFDGAPVDIADGCIHISTADQAEATAAKYFSGNDLLLIAVVFGVSGHGRSLSSRRKCAMIAGIATCFKHAPMSRYTRSSLEVASN
jgi:Protein of unknown function (DUF952)